jgi:hypothetical protein
MARPKGLSNLNVAQVLYIMNAGEINPAILEVPTDEAALFFSPTKDTSSTGSHGE